VILKYQPTPEIQSATINWTFRNNSDNVKVEVWDVVDKAIKSKLASRWSETNNHGTPPISNL
jgi:predicted SnoaL-like aldol condensation-catalyzing enzyme